MYPGVIIEFDDRSDISSLPIAEVRNRPLFCAVFSSDKGVEDWTRISGSDFFDMYGKSISFAKHGQPLLQAAMSINAGAELLCKRIVASDSTLANIGVIATITDKEVQALDSNGNPLYKDESGNQTIENTGDPVMTTEKVIKYSLMSAENISTNDDGSAKTVIDAKDVIKANVDTMNTDAAEGTKSYLLFVVSDNGRGASKKRIKIVPNYRISKSLNYVSYTLSVIEGSSELESLSFGLNPDFIVNGQNISIKSMINTYSTQLRCEEDAEGINEFVTDLATSLGMEAEDLYKYDPLFCCDNKGRALDGISVDSEGIDLQYAYGQILENGSNGSFGAYPINIVDYDSTSADSADEYTKEAIKAFDGSFDKTIFNVDQYKIDAIIDANYPPLVKRSIEALAVFREDFMYFRDQNLGKTSIDLISEEVNHETKSMFCSTYPQSYDVIDPYSKKQITVTIGYDLAQLLVEYCNGTRINPPAGIRNNMVINNAIYGTLSFSPTVCPDSIGGNEKEKMDDLRVCYASYIDNRLVVETLYTSQERNSQWSYINNVMGIQQVVKAIRTKCPLIRYSFIEGEDLLKFKRDVEEIINPFSSDYLQLSMEYVSDATYSANKIFYAVLKVVYKDFEQTEWFKITALSTAEAIS